MRYDWPIFKVVLLHDREYIFLWGSIVLCIILVILSLFSSRDKVCVFVCVYVCVYVSIANLEFPWSTKPD